MYIDTSLLVAFYVPEKLSQQVHDLIVNAEKLYISAFSKLEFLSALNKKVRMGYFARSEVSIAYNEFEAQISQGLYKQIILTPKHYESGSELLFQSRTALCTLDALHLGVVRTEGVNIASNDSVLLQTAKEFNIPTVII